MLDRERRPVFLLDDKGIARSVNREVTFRLGWTESEIVGRDWCDVVVRPPHRERTRSALIGAVKNSGTSAPILLACVTRTGEPVTLIAELTPVVTPTGRYVLMVVGTGEPRPPLPRVSGAETAYEVASHRTGNFGSIRRAWGRLDDPAAILGEHCFRVFYRRETPCPECPAHETDEADKARERVSVIAYPTPSVTLNVVWVDAVDEASISLKVFPVTESLLSELLQKKIGVLANRGGLSDRERAVLDLLLLGRTKENIASVLNISSRTVKYHQRNIQRKLGAESRADLVRLLL
jgi:PAS domain S-box-containing protein